jgi:ABC-2 type transport system permease protein/oleandomycin transport system permease protein
MSATTPPIGADELVARQPTTDGRSHLSHTVTDSLAIASRYLIAYKRLPQLLVFSTIQPIMFVLLFRYVFGGAIAVPGGIAYVDYLMPGIFVQSTVFGAASTGIGLAEDAGKGLIERFRSLPMARSAVLLGRTWADLARNAFVIVLMALVGFLVGFRIQGTWAAFALSLVIILLFAYALSWVTALIGLKASNAEAAQAATFPILFPLTFASSAFVPVQAMPEWLQGFATYQPVSVVINAARSLCLGEQASALYTTPTSQYVAGALAWTVAIVVVFAPLAVRAYRRKVS